MQMRSVIRTCFFCVGIFGGLAAIRLHAQALEAGVVVVSSSHELLGDPLYGGSIGLRFPIRRSRQSLRFELERVAGDAERFGRACGGLIEPGSCAEEPLIDDSRLVRFTAGVGFPLVVKKRGTFAATADLTLGRIRTVTGGVSSGRRLIASKAVMGGLIGAEAAVKPAGGFPLAIQLGAGIGFLFQARPENVADGYTPFNDGFAIRHARLGLSWSR